MHYHGHRQRMKAKLRQSPESLEDYEILELLLGYPLTRRDTKPIAKELLGRCGTLKAILDAPSADYEDISGIGPGVADFFTVLREFLSRYVESDVRTRETLCTPENVVKMARHRLGRLMHEEVWIAYVDNRNRLISWEKASRGTINGVSIHPRDIMETALARKAAGFIIVHNHPGGNAQPSEMDRAFTTQVERAANALFLRFLDHIVVSDSEAYSIMNSQYV
jgi:DNA repair protein RadC